MALTREEAEARDRVWERLWAVHHQAAGNGCPPERETTEESEVADVMKGKTFEGVRDLLKQNEDMGNSMLALREDVVVEQTRLDRLKLGYVALQERFAALKLDYEAARDEVVQQKDCIVELRAEQRTLRSWILEHRKVGSGDEATQRRFGPDDIP